MWTFAIGRHVVCESGQFEAQFVVAKLVVQELVQFVVHLNVLLQNQGLNNAGGLFIYQAFRFYRVDCAQIPVLLVWFLVPLLAVRSLEVHNFSVGNFWRNPLFECLDITVVLEQEKCSHHSFVLLPHKLHNA